MKKPLAHVTDHAVLRYLERVKGLDIGAIRNELGHVVDKAIDLGAGAAVVDGIKYVLDGQTVITCAEVKSIPLRGRANRRRERDAGRDWEGEE